MYQGSPAAVGIPESYQGSPDPQSDAGKGGHFGQLGRGRSLHKDRRPLQTLRMSAPWPEKLLQTAAHSTGRTQHPGWGSPTGVSDNRLGRETAVLGG